MVASNKKATAQIWNNMVKSRRKESEKGRLQGNWEERNQRCGLPPFFTPGGSRKGQGINLSSSQEGKKLFVEGEKKAAELRTN